MSRSRLSCAYVLGDLLGSVAALVAGLVILWTGWTPIDPLLSLLIGVLLVVSSLRLLRGSLSGERVALSAHVVVPDLDTWPALLPRLRAQLADGFHIEHVTLQPEIAVAPSPLVSLGSGSRARAGR